MHSSKHSIAITLFAIASLAIANSSQGVTSTAWPLGGKVQVVAPPKINTVIVTKPPPPVINNKAIQQSRAPVIPPPQPAPPPPPKIKIIAVNKPPPAPKFIILKQTKKPVKQKSLFALFESSDARTTKKLKGARFIVGVGLPPPDFLRYLLQYVHLNPYIDMAPGRAWVIIQDPNMTVLDIIHSYGSAISTNPDVGPKDAQLAETIKGMLDHAQFCQADPVSAPGSGQSKSNPLLKTFGSQKNQALPSFFGACAPSECQQSGRGSGAEYGSISHRSKKQGEACPSGGSGGQYTLGSPSGGGNAGTASSASSGGRSAGGSDPCAQYNKTLSPVQQAAMINDRTAQQSEGAGWPDEPSAQRAANLLADRLYSSNHWGNENAAQHRNGNLHESAREHLNIGAGNEARRFALQAKIEADNPGVPVWMEGCLHCTGSPTSPPGGNGTVADSTPIYDPHTGKIVGYAVAVVGEPTTNPEQAQADKDKADADKAKADKDKADADRAKADKDKADADRAKADKDKEDEDEEPEPEPYDPPQQGGQPNPDSAGNPEAPDRGLLTFITRTILGTHDNATGVAARPRDTNMFIMPNPEGGGGSLGLGHPRSSTPFINPGDNTGGVFGFLSCDCMRSCAATTLFNALLPTARDTCTQMSPDPDNPQQCGRPGSTGGGNIPSVGRNGSGSVVPGPSGPREDDIKPVDVQTNQSDDDDTDDDSSNRR